MDSNTGFADESGRRSGAMIESGYYPKRKLALPKDVEHRSLTTLREKLVKIGAKVVRHGRYVTFQLAGVAIPPPLFAEIPQLIAGL